MLILDELEDVECLQGDTAMFRCRICPSDFIEVKWYLDETQLYTNDLNEIQANPGGYHSLTIKRLARKDSGTISFVAGDRRSYASLLVRGNDHNMWWRIRMKDNIRAFNDSSGISQDKSLYKILRGA